MKKIVVFHHSGDVGGAGISLINTVAMLKEKFEIIVYTPKGRIVERIKQSGVTVKCYEQNVGAISSYSGGPKVISRTYFIKVLQIFKTIDEVRRILKTEKPNIIFLNSITISFLCQVIAREQLPSVVFVRETRRKDIGTYINEWILSRYATAILFISAYDKSNYRIKAKQKHVIYNSLRMEEYHLDITKEEACSRLGVSYDEFNVLYMGGSSPIKGWEIIKKLIVKKIPGVQIIVAGACEEKDIITGSNVRYIGIQHDISLCMKSADVLVFPVTSPHQGRPIFEAGAFSIPVIVPQYSVFEETVIDSYNGMFYEPNNIESLTEKIIYLKNKAQSCKEMGKNNNVMTLRNHLYGVNQKKMIDLISVIAREEHNEENSNNFS